MRRPMDMQCLARLPGFVAREFQILQPRQEIGERDPRLHSRERRAETGVNAMPESNVRVGLAPDIEAIRLAEFLWIAVCRAEHREHELARGNHLFVQSYVTSWCAHQPLNRRTVTQHFLNRRWQQLRTRTEQLELIAVFDQTEHRIVDQV